MAETTRIEVDVLQDIERAFVAIVSGSRFKFADDAVEHFHPETRKRHFYRSYVLTRRRRRSGDRMKTVNTLTLAALMLAGCTASGDTTKRPEIAVAGTASQAPVAGADGSTTFDRPVDRGVMAAGTSPINPDKQVAFCQDQVAFMFKAEPQYVTTRERIVAPDGSTTIDVTVNKGNEGVKAYKCRLDAGNRFIDVIASTSDGTL